jgi:hypothetical protein
MAQLKSTVVQGNLTVTGKIIGDVQSSGGTGMGSVTSVGLSVPTGLTVTGSPITSSGVLAVSLTSGYSIPLAADVTKGVTAHSWGNHADQGYLTSHQSLAGYATQAWVQSQGYLTSHQSLSGYATESWVNSQGFSKFSGSYNSLTDKPTLNFLKYYDSNSYSVNIDTVNTASYLATVSASSGWYSQAGTKPSGMDNAFGVLHIHEHGGNYAMQLGFGGTTNKLYMRNAYDSSTFGAWRIVTTEDWTGNYGNYAKWDYNSSTDCVELVWR